MTHLLRLADNLQIDLAPVLRKRGGQRIAMIGKSGSGKTTSLKTAAKEWMENGWPLAVIDPMNNFRALRDAGLPILVAGTRKSADLLLTLENAAALAEFSFTHRVSVVLDTSMFEEGQDIAVIEAFLKSLWRLILSQDEDAPHQPYALFIDEAHLFVPQVGLTDVSHIINDMGKRGRQLNLSMFFATQRPASISKDFLLMSNLLIAHKVTFGDVGVVADAVSQPPKVISPIMRKMVAGEAIVTGDADLVELGEEDFIRTRIYEFSAAPDARILSTEAGAAGMIPIDATVVEQLRQVMETAKVEDPDADDKDALIETLRATISRLEVQIAELRARPKAQLTLPLQKPITEPISVPTVQRTTAPRLVEAVPINKGARRILEKLADIYPTKVSRKQIATLTGYTESGGTFSANWGSLKRAEYVRDGDYVAILTAGFQYLQRQPRSMPTTSHEVLAMWREVLNKRESEILDILVRGYPGWIGLVELAESINMTASGGAFNGYIGNLRRNGLVESAGGMVCADGASLLLKEQVKVMT
jgi:molybdopterin-guanine dinucleotide biosynthesis protein